MITEALCYLAAAPQKLTLAEATLANVSDTLINEGVSSKDGQTPKYVDLMSCDWLFLDGLLPSRARIHFTNWPDCATEVGSLKDGAHDNAASSRLRDE